MRPCPKCGEARTSHLLDCAPFIGCAGCGHIYPHQVVQPQGAVAVRPGVRVVARGTSGGRPVRQGQCR